MRLGARLGPLGAILFALLLTAATVVIDDYGGTNPDDVADYVADSEGRLGTVFLLTAAAALALLLFTSDLGSRLRRVLPGAIDARDGDGSSDAVAALAKSAGAVSSALLLVAAAFFFAPASASSEEQFEVSGELGNLFSNAGYACLVGAFMALGLFVVTLCLAGRRRGLLPSWLAWSGLVLGAIQVVAFLFLPMVALLLWVLVAGIVLMMRPEPAGTRLADGLGTPAV